LTVKKLIKYKNKYWRWRDQTNVASERIPIQLVVSLRIYTWKSWLAFYCSYTRSGQNRQKNSLKECVLYTPTDCFFGDFAHWAVTANCTYIILKFEGRLLDSKHKNCLKPKNSLWTRPGALAFVHSKSQRPMATRQTARQLEAWTVFCSQAQTFHQLWSIIFFCSIISYFEKSIVPSCLYRQNQKGSFSHDIYSGTLKKYQGGEFRDFESKIEIKGIHRFINNNVFLFWKSDSISYIQDETYLQTLEWSVSNTSKYKLVIDVDVDVASCIVEYNFVWNTIR